MSSPQMTLMFRFWEREMAQHATFHGWRAMLIRTEQVEPDEQDFLELGRRASVCLTQDCVDQMFPPAVQFMRFTPSAATPPQPPPDTEEE